MLVLNKKGEKYDIISAPFYQILATFFFQVQDKLLVYVHLFRSSTHVRKYSRT